MKKSLKIVEEFIAFLDSIDGEEREQARKASRRFKNSLEAAKKDDRVNLLYAFSDKGILDWCWNSNTYSVIHRYALRYSNVCQDEST